MSRSRPLVSRRCRLIRTLPVAELLRVTGPRFVVKHTSRLLHEPGFQVMAKPSGFWATFHPLSRLKRMQKSWYLLASLPMLVSPFARGAEADDFSANVIHHGRRGAHRARLCSAHGQNESNAVGVCISRSRRQCPAGSTQFRHGSSMAGSHLGLYMQGLNTPGQLTDPQGNRPGWQAAIGDQGDRDLKFFDAGLARLKQDYDVDAKRIYCTGHSNGGGFTYLLWLARGDVFAVVAPSSAAARYADKLTAKPALILGGQNDPLVKFAW